MTTLQRRDPQSYGGSLRKVQPRPRPSDLARRYRLQRHPTQAADSGGRASVGQRSGAAAHRDPESPPLPRSSLGIDRPTAVNSCRSSAIRPSYGFSDILASSTVSAGVSKPERFLSSNACDRHRQPHFKRYPQPRKLNPQRCSLHDSSTHHSMRTSRLCAGRKRHWIAFSGQKWTFSCWEMP